MLQDCGAEEAGGREAFVGAGEKRDRIVRL